MNEYMLSPRNALVKYSALERQLQDNVFERT